MNHERWVDTFAIGLFLQERDIRNVGLVETGEQNKIFGDGLWLEGVEGLDEMD